jgi:uncharacterized damage-inducible protein DinB
MDPMETVRIAGMTHYDVEPLVGFDPEIGLLLAGLEDSTREWRENLGEPSIEAIIWQPNPGAYSIGGLLLHLIDCEDSWFHCFAAGNEREPDESLLLMSDETNQYDGSWPVPPAEPISWYLELHDRHRARAFESLRGLEATRVYPRKKYSCTLRWVVAHVLEHDSYTGGQAVALHELWKRRA